jgi:hypothetical protein
MLMKEESADLPSDFYHEKGPARAERQGAETRERVPGFCAARHHPPHEAGCPGEPAEN